MKNADNLYKEGKFQEALEAYLEILSKKENKEDKEAKALCKKIADTYFYKLKDYNNALIFYEKILDTYSNDANVLWAVGYMHYYFDNEKTAEYYLKSFNINPNAAVLGGWALNVLKNPKYKQADIKKAMEQQSNILRKNTLKGRDSFEYFDFFKKNKRLNIGYLSSDFKNHAMMEFVLPLLETHDTDKFNFKIYSTTTTSDYITEKIKKLNMTFNDCKDLNVQEIAEKIHNDKIDILVDLSGYTNPKISCLFFKPAPIIVQYLGFVNTLGIKEVDYIFADDYIIPKDMAKYYTEKPFYIKGGIHYFGFNNRNIKLPSLEENAPYKTNGYMTFGSFNCTSKINNATIALWSKVLKTVPNSKLLIFRTNMYDKTMKVIEEKFIKNDVGKERLIFKRDKTNSFLDAYQTCDIALDAIPFNGLTITMEMLHSGVPVITLPQDSMQSRGCASVLKRLGLNELIAKDECDYIKKAFELSKNPNKIDYYRKNLRAIIENSPIKKDYRKFSSSVEEGYQKIWREYCKKQASFKSKLKKIIEILCY